MPHDSDRPRDSREPPLERFEWHEVRAEGCYLHLASGLVARIYGEDLASGEARRETGGGPVVLLDANPGAPMEHLRRVAARHGLRCTA